MTIYVILVKVAGAKEVKVHGTAFQFKSLAEANAMSLEMAEDTTAKVIPVDYVEL